MTRRAVKAILAVRFARDISGSIAIMTAAFLMVAIAATALAIDVGSLYLERRTLQGVADLAAVSGASDIDHAEAAVAATLKANGITAHYTIERGQYSPDPRVDHTQRFAPSKSPYNAVRVTLEQPGQLYFANAFADQDFKIGVSATAANGALAAFSGHGCRQLATADMVIGRHEAWAF